MRSSSSISVQPQFCSWAFRLPHLCPKNLEHLFVSASHSLLLYVFLETRYFQSAFSTPQLPDRKWAPILSKRWRYTNHLFIYLLTYIPSVFQRRRTFLQMTRVLFRTQLILTKRLLTFAVLTIVHFWEGEKTETSERDGCKCPDPHISRRGLRTPHFSYTRTRSGGRGRNSINRMYTCFY